MSSLTAAPPPRVRAPRLPGDPALWLNVGKGASLPRVGAGTVLLLDFFTHGCINCQHVLPDLAHLERRFAGDPLLVVGVHSPKFDAEKGDAALRTAVERLGIAHPVARDDAHELRSAFAVRAWPTLVLIDGAGYVVGHWRGEGHRDEIEAAIAAALGHAGAPSAPPAAYPHSELSPLLAGRGGHLSPLRFPAKVLADAEHDRLFIADTGNGRIVVTRRDGGDAHALCDDEPLHSPQGMALSPGGRWLYVAEAGRHTVRRIDLEAGDVETLAGTGRQALGPVGAGPARETDLNSPWDLCQSVDGRALYVAMAGSHQIIVLDVGGGTGSVKPFAGNGREGRADGPAAEASFAQPSGLATDGARLFVADAESGCIRTVDLTTGRVSTLAGGDLFDFGWRDGRGDGARFQHPLGVTYDAGAGFLYVADTYNHRVRRLDPRTGDVTTVAGSGYMGDLWEPSGLSCAGGVLYVADTNHHRVRVADPQTGRLTDLRMPGLCAPGLCFADGEAF